MARTVTAQPPTTDSGRLERAPIPKSIVQNPNGSVDVNGDGQVNGVFMGSQDIGLYDSTIERKRDAFNASFQADLDHGLKLTSDYFYAIRISGNAPSASSSTRQLGGRDLRAVAIEEHRSTALSQYGTLPR